MIGSLNPQARISRAEFGNVEPRGVLRKVKCVRLSLVHSLFHTKFY